MMKIYNTLTRRKEEFKPIHEGKVLMYSCGPTVYNYAHIGNLSAYLMADVLRRTLEYLGYEVEHVKNITDVGHMTNDDETHGEDKMEKAAREAKKDPYEIARFYEKAFREDEAKLGIKPADHYPRATDYVVQMLAMIEKLVASGHAYVADDGVYFDITSFPKYGNLSGNTLDALIAGARIDVNELKKNPMDFALWKLNQPKHIMQWDSPWGKGYPGWHIECSAMSTTLLGESIDIHTGGVDNIFPHHECEIAQSESVFGKQFVKYWVHKGYLKVEGEKMSKSKGNFYTLRDLEELGYDPVLFRYLVVSSHYRSPVNFSFQGLEEAKASIGRLEEFYRFIHKLKPTHAPSHEELMKLLKEAQERFNEKLSDDLNTPEALAEVFLFVKNVYRLNLEAIAISDRNAITELIEVFNAVFGVLEFLDSSDPEKNFSREVENTFSPDVLALRSQRIEAKKNKNYAEADRLRDLIQKQGIKVIDNPDGSMTLEQQGKW